MSVSTNAIITGESHISANIDPVTGGSTYSDGTNPIKVPAGGLDLSFVGGGQRQSGQPVRVALFGDSTAELVAGGPYDIRYLNAIDPATGAWPAGTVNLAHPAAPVTQLPDLYPNAFLVGDGGVGGETLAQMLARDAAGTGATVKSINNVCSARPDAAIINAGINTLANASVATYVAVADAAVVEAKKIMARFTSAGVFVFFQSIYGYSGGAADPAGVRLALLRYNATLSDYCAANPGVYKYVDGTPWTMDAAGNFLSTNIAADGLHLTAWGKYLVDLNATLPAFNAVYGKSSGSRYSGANFVSDPFFNTTATGGSGTIGTSVTVGTLSNCTAANGKVETINGKVWQTVELTPTTVAAMSGRMTLALTPSAWGVGPGDFVGFEVDVYIAGIGDTAPPAGLSSSTQARVSLVKTAAGTLNHDMFAYSKINAGFSGTAPWIRHCYSQPVKLSEGSAALAASSLYFQIGSDGTAPIKIGISEPRAVKIASTGTSSGGAPLSTVPTGSAVALTTATPANVTSISLPPGEWDVSGVVNHKLAATTSVTQLNAGISLTSATLMAQDGAATTSGQIGPDATITQNSAATVPAGNVAQVIPPVRLSLYAQTTVYLVAQDTFSVSTAAAFGTIRARAVV